MVSELPSTVRLLSYKGRVVVSGNGLNPSGRFRRDPEVSEITARVDVLKMNLKASFRMVRKCGSREPHPSWWIWTLIPVL
jgi:hypothetical protein